MDGYQPNSDNAHDHTYPQQTEGLRRFDIHTGPERMHTWCTALERRIEALEANAAEQARLIEELRRACSIKTAAESMARHRGECCTWYFDDVNGTWVSNCGMEFLLNDGGPTENAMRNCPRCGLPLVERDSNDK